MRLKIISLFAAAALGTFAASPLAAHAHLVNSTPAPNSTAANPRAISLTFSERLVPAFSKLQLAMSMGGHNMAVPVKTAVAADGRTLVATPRGALLKGSYVVNWTAATLDGHKMTGSLQFRVG